MLFERQKHLLALVNALGGEVGGLGEVRVLRQLPDKNRTELPMRASWIGTVGMASTVSVRVVSIAIADFIVRSLLWDARTFPSRGCGRSGPWRCLRRIAPHSVCTSPT